VSDELSIPRSPVYRVPRRSGPEPLTRRLALIAGGLTGALVLIVVLWSSVGHHGGTVPVVQADRQPVRVKPANPGGMQIPGLSTDTGTADAASDADKLAPAPETPDPQALARQAPPAPAVSQATAIQASTPQTAKLAGPLAPAPTQSPIAAAAPLTRVVGTPPPAVAKPAQIAAAAMPEQHAAPSALRTPAGGTQVQLAAVATEAAARHEWTRLVHNMPGVFSHHHPVFSKIEHDGHTLWRVRTGDFATESEASEFCGQVRAKGAGCAVAAF
jgi:hypothetical protein